MARLKVKMTIIEPSSDHRPARWATDGTLPLECGLCPHHCLLDEGGTGVCRTRGVRNGRMVVFNYGRVCAQAVDQIEKKPIYHYRPGSKLLSVGTFGCNLDCDCCQNAALASAGPEAINCMERDAESLVAFALEKGVQGLAFTFNEPLVWYEFIIDAAKLARASGLYTMMNTNGFVEEGPLKELSSLVDVFKVDVKGFTEKFYKEHCGGSLAPVLRTCEHLKGTGDHLEVAYLIIPGLNDGAEELNEFFRWVHRSLGPRLPVHLYRFMPAHRLLDLPSTSMEGMKAAKDAGKREGLDFIYLSGMVEGDEHQTYCPGCGLRVIDRAAKEVSEKIVFDKERLSKFCPSYSEISDLTDDGRCPKCREIIYRRL